MTDGGTRGRVLVVGGDDRATTLATALSESGVDALHAESAPVGLSTLGATDVRCVVLVEDGTTAPRDFFGAASRQGGGVPGIYVGAEARPLPPGVDQVPDDVDVAASRVRQRLLSRAAADADPLGSEDPLAAYGSTVAHELRNHVEAASLAVESLEGDTKGRAQTALDRLTDLATEAEAVATGRVSRTATVSLTAAASAAADRVHATDATVNIETDRTVEANEALVTLLFENLFRNAVEHGATDGEDGVTVRVFDTDEGFAVADDGPGFEGEDPFDWGYTTGDGDGTGLAVVERIAAAHDWTVSAANDGGARVDVTVH